MSLSFFHEGYTLDKKLNAHRFFYVPIYLEHDVRMRLSESICMFGNFEEYDAMHLDKNAEEYCESKINEIRSNLLQSYIDYLNAFEYPETQGTRWLTLTEEPLREWFRRLRNQREIRYRKNRRKEEEEEGGKMNKQEETAGGYESDFSLQA